MIQKFRTISPRRRLVAVLMALSLMVTSIASLAVLTDTLVVTNNYSVQNVDLTGNGLQSVSNEIYFEGTSDPRAAALLTVKNTGTTALRYAARSASTANGLSTKATTQAFVTAGTLALATAQANCDSLEATNQVPTGWTLIQNYNAATELSHFGFGDPAAGPQTDDRPLAVGASEHLCLLTSVKTGSNLAQSDTATQTITFSAEQSS